MGYLCASEPRLIVPFLFSLQVSKDNDDVAVRYTSHTSSHTHIDNCPHTHSVLTYYNREKGGENTAMTVSFLSITRV